MAGNHTQSGAQGCPSYERTKELLQELIRTDTSQPGGNERRLTEKLEELFEGRTSFDRICHGGQRQCLLVRISSGQDSEDKTGKVSEKKNGGLVLCGHLDTVPCGDSQVWDMPPLSGEFRDGRIYGRGAADMKGGVAAMCEAAIRFASKGGPRRGRLKLLFVADEECSNLGTHA